MQGNQSILRFYPFGGHNAPQTTVSSIGPIQALKEVTELVPITKFRGFHIQYEHYLPNPTKNGVPLSSNFTSVLSSLTSLKIILDSINK